MNVQQVMAHAGITYRQLDHWCTKGYIKPVSCEANPGSGHQRLFTSIEGDKARLMRCLMQVGFTASVAELLSQLNTYQMQTKRLFLGHGITLLIEPHPHRGE